MSSLDQLLDCPALHDSFRSHARVDALRRAPGAWESAHDPVMSGWALAYLCQFEAARWARAHRAPVAQVGWVAQIGLHNLRLHPLGREHAPLWRAWMDQEALPMASHYVAGGAVPFRQLATLAWRLAHLDSVCRQPSPLWHRMASLPQPRLEHINQLALWWRRWKQGLPPAGAPVILNADLAPAGCVRHGESAMIVGDTLLAVRVLKAPQPEVWAHRLSGQAAWLERVGTHGTLGTWPIRFVRICFVRAGAGRSWMGWDLDALFPSEHWEQYGDDILRAAQR